MAKVDTDESLDRLDTLAADNAVRTASGPGAQSFPTLFRGTEIALGIDKTKHSEVRLSAREQMIVHMMGHGLSNKGIARQLSIAPETVKSHAKNIFWKLAARSRAEAVYRAVALGLI